MTAVRQGQGARARAYHTAPQAPATTEPKGGGARSVPEANRDTETRRAR